jgi:hypothetical protein
MGSTRGVKFIQSAAPSLSSGAEERKMKKLWTCKIGETEFDQHGMDAPMRRAVRDAYLAITGKEPDFIFSGWAGELDELSPTMVAK